MQVLSVHVPISPPGINSTYSITSIRGRAHMFKTIEAENWATQAALIIGAKAGEVGWKDDSEYYELSLVFTNWRLDVDAPLKLCQDVICQKLGFDDKRIIKVTIEKVKTGNNGVFIELKNYEATQT